ncbi:DNA-binding protein [Paenibacillus sp. J53TS2]|uniref:ImmA/IrrE family metallo-endopeptidase n=1 Tax=Paenibacillus sp. J53TS2 TaxID=2807197 RepID=UPI001B14BE55|nr:ImmA/IrrE family metallo-endopeptidase [Paenibacillus sp. J53TS2]GIP48999.1 DNA-binding protein [Paenibacillus sp. J53TS2]
MARVEVSPDLLRWAVTRTGIAEAIENKFPKLNQWIAREEYPTLKQLELFAKATYTPLGCFFLESPPEERLPIPHFRTLGDQGHAEPPSPDLLETVQIIERRQQWLRDYLIEQYTEPLKFVGSFNHTEEPKKVAIDIRKALNLPNGWASHSRNWQEALRLLQKAIEDIGIYVMMNGIVGNNTRRKLSVQEFRGFVLVDNYAPIIFLNSSDGKAAQMFTLAHELAHIWFGKSAIFDLEVLQPADNETEVACNSVAAEFLVPESDLLKYWPLIKLEQYRFQKLARHFKVSEIVAARRALDLGLIDRGEFFEFYTEYVQRVTQVTQDSSGGDYYRTQGSRIGRRFAETVITAAREGNLLYRDAYRLTGMTGKTFTEFTNRLGSGGTL